MIIPCQGCAPPIGRSGPRHIFPCPVALAFRLRCPECRSRKREDGSILHANHCQLKEVQP